jgi:hypothetical protein
MGKSFLHSPKRSQRNLYIHFNQKFLKMHGIINPHPNPLPNWEREFGCSLIPLSPKWERE